MIVRFILPFLCLISSLAATEIEVGNEIARLKPLEEIQYSHHHKETAHDHFNCPTTQGRFAHPSDCALYYECKNGWPTLKKCRNNQLYDEEKKQCKDKRRVQCHKDDQDQDKDKDENKEVDFKCPYIWGSFPHPVDCSKYYLCVYNVPALLSCGKSELYHEKARKCLDKRKVNCGSRLDRDEMRTSRKPSTKYHTSTTTTIRSTDWRTTSSILTTVGYHQFHCPFKYGRYPDPQDCSRFYECSFFIPRHHHCPRSMLYDERKEECRESEKVRCGNRPGGNKEEPEEEEKEDFKCPYVWGTFPHPRDCSKYIICVYNVPTLFHCRKDELFDAYSRRCRPKDQVDCDYRIDFDDLTKPTKTTRTTRPITKTTNNFTKTTGTTIFTSRKPFTKTSWITTPFTRIISTVKPFTETTATQKTRWTVTTNPSTTIAPNSETNDISTTESPQVTTLTTKQTTTEKETSTTIPQKYSTVEKTSTEYPSISTNTPTEAPTTVTEIFTEHPITVTEMPTEMSTNDVDETSAELTTIVSEESTIASSTKIPLTTMTSTEFSTGQPTTEILLTTEIITSNTPTIPSTTTIGISTVTPKTEILDTTMETAEISTDQSTKIPITTKIMTDTSDATTPTIEIPSTTQKTTRISTSTPTTIILKTTKHTTKISTSTQPTTISTTTKMPTDVPFTLNQTDSTLTKQTSRSTETVTASITTTDFKTKPTDSSTKMVTKVNTPPATDCDEDDIDCIIDETGDVEDWFKCPERYGHFPHPSSRQLFIHCDNWHPFLKSCADETVFSPKYLVCMWIDKNKGITE